MDAINLLAYTTRSDRPESSVAGVLLIGILIIFWLILIVACWRVYQKAKKPGWAAIIPLYNIYVLLKIVGRPGWWLLLYLIPIVNVIVHLIVSFDTAKAFRKSGVFGFFWLWLFSPIGYLVLGYGDAKYKGVPKR